MNKHHILQFEISVHDLESVQIVQAAEQLFEDAADDFFVEMLSGFDEINYRASIAKLCYNLIVPLPLENLVQLDDVGVIQLFEQLELSEDLVHLGVVKIIFFDAFDCPDLLGFEADCFEDAAVGALSDFLLHFVVVSYIFFSKENELLLVDLYSSEIIILYLSGNDELLQRRLELKQLVHHRTPPYRSNF